jgi:hypothetical protein
MNELAVQVEIDPHSERFHSLHGSCAPTASTQGSYHVRLRALDYVICEAG